MVPETILDVGMECTWNALNEARTCTMFSVETLADQLARAVPFATGREPEGWSGACQHDRVPGQKCPETVTLLRHQRANAGQLMSEDSDARDNSATEDSEVD